MRALVIGVGGLGCPASMALAPQVGQLTLVDFDVVASSNLHRQPWHHPQDVGRPKVDSATEKIRALFPQLTVVGLSTKVTEQNVDPLLKLHDVVIDGTDTSQMKFVLNDAAVRARKPLIYGGVLRFSGQAMRIEPGGPCLRCLFEGPPPEGPTCAQAGVLGSIAGVIGGLQAQLALTPNPVPEETMLHLVDGLAFRTRQVRVKKVADCSVCAS